VQEAINTICDRFAERRASLFLGAGINAGVSSKAGESFPLGRGLSDLIARDLLEEPGAGYSLQDAAEMARYRVGDRMVNDYIYERFSCFDPGTAHLALVQLPWDVIYTTNYDPLVERAADGSAVRPAGQVRPIVSINTDLTPFTDEDILYYKLHGSVDIANTEEGRLVLTREDYRYYEDLRKPFFARLRTDLTSRTFVFVGYSLSDDNFRATLEDCRNQLDVETLPLSFAVRQSFTPIEEVFWREKYNIQLIAADAADFLCRLKESWFSQDRAAERNAAGAPRLYVQADEQTRFPKVGESFYRLLPQNCTGPSNPKPFFLGAEPSWGSIRDAVPAQRDAYWTLLETLFPELVQPGGKASAYLVTGAAGTGKTTLVRSVAYLLAKDFELPVVFHLPGTPLDVRVLGQLFDPNNPKRIIVVVRHAAELVRELQQFLEDARQRSLPIILLLEERKNQWLVASSTARMRLAPDEFELGSLSPGEIERILESLGKHGALGKLTGTPWVYQVEHFTALADKELLVALRELTSDANFDDIVRDEFAQIPTEVARKAYSYVAAVGQADLPLRYEIVIRLLGLRYDELRRELFDPTAGVLISTEQSGNSRHNEGWILRTRHPVIASIIFAEAARDDDAKYGLFNDILTQMDPGFLEDRRLLNEIARKKELVGTLASLEKRRAVYDRLQSLLPRNPYVLQHRAILEKSLNNPEAAMRYARKATAIEPNNPVLLNTLGMALEAAARSTKEPLQNQSFSLEASKLFEDGIRRDPTDPYGYLGKVLLTEQAIAKEKDEERRAVLRAGALSLLEQAYEATGEAQVIASELANYRKKLGSEDDAIAMLRTGLKKDPTDMRLRDLLVRFLTSRVQRDEALKVAMDGTKFDPTSWRMQRHIARLKQDSGAAVDTVKGHYEAAIRHNRGDVALRVELGAYLFEKNLLPQANVVFSEARNLPVSSAELHRVRRHWEDSHGHDVMFEGRVKSINATSAYVIAIPENYEAYFWRGIGDLSDLKEGDPVTFSIGFNARGAVAQNIRSRR